MKYLILLSFLLIGCVEDMPAEPLRPSPLFSYGDMVEMTAPPHSFYRTCDKIKAVGVTWSFYHKDWFYDLEAFCDGSWIQIELPAEESKIRRKT